MRSTLEGRSELKYALPAARRGEVLALAQGHIEVGAYTGSLADHPGVRWQAGEPEPMGYLVHSLYLDTPRLDGYGERLADASIRNRVRIRTYGTAGQDAAVYLEAKRKLHERVIKQRVSVGRLSAWSRLPGPRPWVAAVAALPPGDVARQATRWLAAVEGPGMVPVCSTHYLREVYEAGTDRLTIDHQVRGAHGLDPRAFQSEGEIDLVPPDWIVLELKFGGPMPGWMRTLVRQMRLCSEPVSKFALGVALTLRVDHPLEGQWLTPPSVLRAGRRADAAEAADTEPEAMVAR